jgi:cob(I)alamin adenosyltransferase
MNNKIYTKTGDDSKTSLLGGRRVPKYHLKIEAYGTADELNAFIGVLRDQDISSHHKQVLLKIQKQVFTAESLLARDEGSENIELPHLNDHDINFLEQEIDIMNHYLPPLSNFILPGGHQAVSYAHVCRVICRRAERIIVKLHEESPVDDVIIRYFNRLSDYFFMLARRIAFDHNIADNPWKPREE